MSNPTFRQKCEQRRIPIISSNTEDFLCGILEKYEPKICLEIGSAVAYSTCFMAKKISNRNGKIYSFERSYPAYLEGLRNLSQLTQKNATLYPFNFLDIQITKFIPKTESIDFAFIDAQKSQYGDYMMKIRNLLSTSAIVVIDDVIKYHHKMSGLYEFLEQNQIQYTTHQLDADDGVILIEK